MVNVVDLYRQRLKENGFSSDSAQEGAIAALQKCQDDLLANAATKQGFIARLWGKKKNDAVRGVYMYGGVGRGKSFIMDCFFDVRMLSGVPKMTPQLASEARCFTLLVDVLYDRHNKLILSAAVPSEQLYTEGALAYEFVRTVSGWLRCSHRNT